MLPTSRRARVKTGTVTRDEGEVTLADAPLAVGTAKTRAAAASAAAPAHHRRANS